MSNVEVRRVGPGMGLLALLLIATAMAHSSALDGAFVFDDTRFVPENRALADLGNLPRYFTDLTTMTSTQGIPGWNDIYRPLRTLSFAIDWQIDGPNPFVYRLMNLLWHLLATALAWLLVRRLLGSALLATIGAGLFALHPVQTQTVSWVSSRGDILAAVFLLGGALCLLREDAGRRATVGGVVLYTLALFSKENAIALLAIVPFYDLLLPRDRPRLRGRLYGVMLAITIAFVAVRIELTVAQQEFAFARWLEAGSALVITVGGLLFPVGLSPFTGDIFANRLTLATGGIVLALAGALVAIALWRGRRAPLVAFSFLWAAACLAPVSGLVPLKSLAECRFSYLPAFGLGLLLAVLARRIGKPGPVFGFVVLALLGTLTFSESKIWRNDRSLWDAAEVRQRRAFGEAGALTLGNIGTVLAAEGKHEEALSYFRRSLTQSDTPLVRVKTAIAHLELGQKEQAVEAAAAAVRRFPDSVPARATYGGILLNMGRRPEAEIQFRIALESAPERGHLHRDLGASLLEQARLQEAVTALLEAVRLAPWDAEARVLLGSAYLAGGRPENAEREFTAAVSLDESSPKALLFLGRLYLDKGQTGRALLVLERALARAPENPAVRAEWAAAALQGSERVDPRTVRELRVAGQALLEIGDPYSAAAALDRPAVRALRDRELSHLLVQALMMLKDGRRARAILEEVIEVWSDEPRFFANLGFLELHERQYAKAAEMFEKAIEKDEKSSFLHLSLARAYRGLERGADAERAAREAMRLARNRAEAEQAQRFLETGR